MKLEKLCVLNASFLVYRFNSFVINYYFTVCARAVAENQEPYSIRAQCFRSMRKNENPHQVQVSVDFLDCSMLQRSV